jgi:glycine/D-amino acid oxidase-like deaminating enzyme
MVGLGEGCPVEGSQQAIAVIGAGIVGSSVALELRRAGRAVTLIDAQTPGSGASFGNACMISPDFCIPASIPGMLKKVPGWLRDPLGPLAIRPAYFPKALPWLLRWAKAGRLDRVLAGSDALRSLHLPAFDRYREMLGPKHFADLIRTNGQIYYWEGEGAPATQPVRDAIWQRHGVVTEALPLEQLRKLVPALTPHATSAVLFPKNGNTINPQRLVQTIAALFTEAGGTLVQQNVLKIIPESDGYRIVTGTGNLRAQAVVIAAGAWSQRLAAPLGYRFPLETERGYHVTFHRPNVQPPPMPILCSNRPAAASPLDDGIRCAGSVEFAGLDAPMNEKRATIMLKRAQGLLPGLEIKHYSIWMGHRPSFPDSLPVIDRAPRHRGLFFAFGHGHSGMSSGPMTGKLIAELVADRRPSVDLNPFRTTRF